MKKDVLIKISGLQPEVQGDDAIEMTSVGTYMQREGVWYLSYDEEDEGRLSKCRIKATREYVELTKQGHITTRLVFTPGEVFEALYATPYGDLDMKLLTKSLTVHEDDDCLDIKLIYELGLNGQFISNCELNISVEEIG